MLLVIYNKHSIIYHQARFEDTFKILKFIICNDERFGDILFAERIVEKNSFSLKNFQI
jgi:hypothetical protein